MRIQPLTLLVVLTLVGSAVACKVHFDNQSWNISTISEKQIFNEANDPALPISISSGFESIVGGGSHKKPLVQSLEKSLSKLSSVKAFTIVFAGTCASCSLSAIDPVKLSERLGSSRLLVVVYASDSKEILRQFAVQKRDMPANLVFVVDGASKLHQTANSFFPYRHGKGHLGGSKLILTSLQHREQPESDFYQ